MKNHLPATIVLSLSLPLLLLLASLDSVWTDLNNYEPVFSTSSYGRDQSIQATKEVMRFIRAPAQSKLNIPGFSERELTHMHDVRYAFHLGKHAFAILFFFWMLGLIAHAQACARALTLGGTLTLAVLALIFIIPFEYSFSAFHSLFFEPGSWIFSPTNTIITLYPQSLFERLAGLIAIRTAILGVVSIALGGCLCKVVATPATPCTPSLL